MTERLYDLYATWTMQAGRPHIARLGHRDDCQREAAELRRRGFAAHTQRVGQVNFPILPPRPGEGDDQFEYVRGAA